MRQKREERCEGKGGGRIRGVDQRRVEFRKRREKQASCWGMTEQRKGGSQPYTAYEQDFNSALT